ncbi:EAL domain-containing protein [Pseudahrensia aquimaris]|uniref:EAL domain-containing protein n=1 Tax=Pseudahrensia aquimaris TaxID=744461 RepID=A0ABW3FJM5_9HYPH
MRNYVSGLRKRFRAWLGLAVSSEHEFGEQNARMFRAERLTSVYSMTGAMMVGNLVFAPLLTINLLGNGLLLNAIALIWCGLLCGLSLMMLYHARQRRRAGTKPSGSRNGIVVLARNSAFLSALWCAPIIVFYALTDSVERGVIAAIMAGILAAGAASLSRVPIAAYLWLFIAGMVHTVVTLVSFAVSQAFGDLTLAIFSAVATAGLVLAVRQSDITLREQFGGRLQLAEKNEVINLLLKDYENQSSEWLWETDADGRIMRAPHQVYDMLGIDMEATADIPLSELVQMYVTDECRADLQRLMECLKEDKEFTDIILSIRDTTDDTTKWIMVRGLPKFEDGVLAGYRGICADATATAEARKQIHFMAHHDGLTGLENRHTASERKRGWLKSERQFAEILIDLDRFKQVNDTFGHGVGDDLLVAVAQRIEKALDRAGVNDPDCRSIARFGGDEFAVGIVEDRRSNVGAQVLERVAEDVSQNIVDLLCQPFQIAGQTVDIGASVGFSVGMLDTGDLSELSKQADIALYRAKEEGRGTWRRFTSEMDETHRKERALVADMRLAIQNGDFSIAYQPIVKVAEDGSTKTVSREALIRWDHPVHGAISPAVFIPLAEETDMVLKIGQYVLRKACEDASNWNDSVLVSVNVSARQIQSPDFVPSVLSALAHSGLSAQRLEIEITESAMILDTDLVVEVVQRLRNLGVRTALDDFGTGYSSLSYLSKFNIDRIKIDRAFISAEGASGLQSPDIIEAIIGLAETFDMDVVSEGVETPQQAKALFDMGCTIQQGYLHGRPGQVSMRKGKELKIKQAETEAA